MTEAAELIEQIKNSNDTYRRNQCRHTLPEGERCGSPAMRGEKFCYYHHETRKPVADAHHRQARRNRFELPKPTIRAAIQDALGEIIIRIGYNDIDPRRAGLLLYALQIASTNIKDHQNTQQQLANPTSTNPAEVEETGTVIPTEAAQPRSGGICFSTDTARSAAVPEAEPAFETEIFPPPQPQLSPIRRQTFAALLDSLARHNGIEPQIGSPEDRRPEAHPAWQVLPSLQAAPSHPLPPKAEHGLKHHRRQKNPLHRPKFRSNPVNPTSPSRSQMSPNCREIVISSHKVLPSEHLGSLQRIRRYITYLS